MSIGGSVGLHAINDPADVRQVEEYLALHQHWLVPLRALSPDGICNEETIAAIKTFQARACAYEPGRVDGVVSPRGFTIRQLERGFIPKPSHPVFDLGNFQEARTTLENSDYVSAANDLGCEAAALQAISRKETKGSPWYSDGRPAILFERHYFRRLTGGIYDRTHPDISGSAYTKYGTYSSQYVKLYRAATLDQSAALKSASWGRFQMMGEYFADYGFDSVEDFVSAVMVSESGQLTALKNRLKAKTKELEALKKRDWQAFGKSYNGANAPASYGEDVEKYYHEALGK